MAKWHFRAITVKRDAVCWCEGRGCTLSSRLREGEPDTMDQQAVPDLILAATSASQITLSLYAITLAWVSRLSRNETFPEASLQELIQKTYCYWASLSYTRLSFNLQNWKTGLYKLMGTCRVLGDILKKGIIPVAVQTSVVKVTIHTHLAFSKTLMLDVNYVESKKY